MIHSRIYFKQIKKSSSNSAQSKKAKAQDRRGYNAWVRTRFLDRLLEEDRAKLTVFHRIVIRSSAAIRRAERGTFLMKFEGRAFQAKPTGSCDRWDADRFGVVDQDGTWITPNQILALALYHLKKNRG